MAKMIKKGGQLLGVFLGCHCSSFQGRRPPRFVVGISVRNGPCVALRSAPIVVTRSLDPAKKITHTYC